MPQVETTAGPIDSGDMGLTLVHEHMRTRSEAIVVQFPHLYDDEREYARAVETVRGVMERGVKTICDPTVMHLGRDIRFMSSVAEATGIQLVPATGVYTYHYLEPHFQNRDVDYMVDVLVRDIEVGIQGTDVKAAFLKCCTDEQGVTDDVEKSLRASAQAALRTGRPIMTHSHPKSGAGLEQMRIFEEEGVDPARVLIGHTGDTDDLEYIEKLLDTGPFIGMDRYGLDVFLPTAQRNATVVELARRGYADRMMLSQDACCNFDWFPEEVIEEAVPDWTMTFLLDSVLPMLEEAGVTGDQIATMMEENPRRWLAGEPAKAEEEPAKAEAASG